MQPESGATLMSNVGRWLDRGINKLMGAPEASPASPPLNRPSAPGVPRPMSHPMSHAQGAGDSSAVPPGALSRSPTEAAALPAAVGMLSSGQEEPSDVPGYRRSASEASMQKVWSFFCIPWSPSADVQQISPGLSGWPTL